MPLTPVNINVMAHSSGDDAATPVVVTKRPREELDNDDENNKPLHRISIPHRPFELLPSVDDVKAFMKGMNNNNNEYIVLLLTANWIGRQDTSCDAANTFGEMIRNNNNANSFAAGLVDCHATGDAIVETLDVQLKLPCVQVWRRSKQTSGAADDNNENNNNNSNKDAPLTKHAELSWTPSTTFDALMAGGFETTEEEPNKPLPLADEHGTPYIQSVEHFYNVCRGTNESENDNKKPYAVIVFSATWCPPCKRLGPNLPSLQSEFDSKAVFYKCDRDAFTDLHSLLNIDLIPQTVVYRRPEDDSSTTSSTSLHEVDRLQNSDVTKVKFFLEKSLGTLELTFDEDF
eukprot:PhM_4_TR4723/c0_g1_i1/m.89700